jgi:hypothetical protein
VRTASTCPILAIALLYATLCVCHADDATVEKVQGKAYLTLTVDLQSPANFAALLVSLTRGSVQTFAAPPGWSAAPEGDNAVRFTPDGTVPFTGTASGFMLKVSGPGVGTWATYYRDGSGMPGLLGLKH